MNGKFGLCPLISQGASRVCDKECAWYIVKDHCCAMVSLARNTYYIDQALLLIKEELRGGIITYEQN